MIVELTLENYRGFKNHTVPLKPTSIIVGSNNAGKSTLIEALRLISIVTNRYSAINFSDAPRWLELPRSSRGVVPSLKNIDFNMDSLFFRLGEPPAKISATFTSGATIDLYLGPNSGIFAQIKDASGKAVGTKGQANSITLPSVSILPQVAPIAREETILNPEYARRVINSSWASLHFRNQLNLYFEHFPEFKRLAEATWKGLRIIGLEGQGEIAGNPLLLTIQDQDFVAEVAWMGHGLQMWLQTMWFLARSQDNSTVILDEPDVYLHADLQRKLIRILREQGRQTIVATHSIEIISEVDADDILVINRRANKSSFATSLPAVQNTIRNIGSIHNLHVTRLWNARRCLLLEGKDISFLKAAQNLLFPHSAEPLDVLPHIPVGGWGGWDYAIGSRMLLKNAFDETIVTYCIFDRDYHTDEEINERKVEADTRGIQIHIWSKKEIENYFIIPSAIARIIASDMRKGDSPPTVNEVEEAIDEIVEQLKEAVFDALSTEIYHQNKSKNIAYANDKARTIIKTAWDTSAGRLNIVSGKQVLSQLSKWSQRKYGVSFNGIKILRLMRPSEVYSEFSHVIHCIEKSKLFTP